MRVPDLPSFGEALLNGIFFTSATVAPHPRDVARASQLSARAAAAGTSLCVATLPASCALLSSSQPVLLLGTIPYACYADIKSISVPVYTTVSTKCLVDFALTGSTLLACVKSNFAASPVSTTCSQGSTASSTASSTAASLTASGNAASGTSGASTGASATVGTNALVSEAIVAPKQDYVRQGAAPVAKTNVVVNGNVISTNTSTATNTTSAPVNATFIGTTTIGTILVIARDTASSYAAYSGLNGYGIPFQVLLVPQAGTLLPSLNDSATVGNFGGIVILSEVSYDFGTAGGGFQSALTAAQWTTLFTYQLAFAVRMVRLDVFPSADSGTLAQGGCCAAAQEQFISISNSTAFPTAGLITGATLSTIGLYHYPATITNSTIATEFAQFGATAGYTSTSTAAVINNISGRQQMVFFTSFATDWSPTSNFLQHAWIHWITRGLYAGYRRVNLGTQIDDMFLISDIYYPGNNTFRIRTGDLDAIKSWIPSINSKMPSGSSYFMEIGHNGNGNIEQSASLDTTNKLCGIGPIEYADQIDTTLEFQKVLGTGTNLWPAKPSAYPYTVACTNGDPLKVWWSNTANRDVFGHISHTFTHEGEDNATYFDIFNEISWNKAWLDQVTLSAAKHFSPNGLIPPAITGLHNGDALSAWSKNGITSCVGDNTRPVLMNTANEHWPLITTLAGNGFVGMQVTPRWATNIYYNCDSAICTVQEWINTSAGSGDISTLLTLERTVSSRHLLGLHHDPFMFHQANLRQTDVTSTVVNGVSSQFALIQMWVETVVNEMARLVSWPIITLKHDDIGASFAQRMARDGCNPKITYQLGTTAKTITGIQITTTGNTCSSPIPVTVPGSVTNTQGFTTEKIGSDPLTIWVKMTGAPVTFTLSPAVPL